MTPKTEKPNIKIVAKHNHVEAFSVMHYGIELYYNSRDGVTPFMNDKEQAHTNWQLDVYDPLYVPPVGSKIWCDARPDLVRDKVIKFVDSNWDHPEYPLSSFRDTKAEAIAFFIEEWCWSKSHITPKKYPQPWCLEVTQEIHDNFKARKEAFLNWKLF